MKDPDCNCSSEVIWRYIDRELPAREMAVVSDQIRSCDTCRSMYEGQALLARSLSTAFVDSPFGESFVSRSRERFGSAGLGDFSGDGLRTIRGGTKLLLGYRAFSLLRSRRALGIAALLLLVPAIIAIGLLVSSGREQSLGGLRVTGRDEVGVRVVGSSSEIIFIQPQPGRSGFQAGRVYDVPAGTTLSLTLGAGDGGRDPAARLDVAGPARFSTDPDCTVRNFHGNLISGDLRARVSPRGAGESFRISSGGLHQARVIGTVFVLSARDGATSLTVEEGLVGFGVLGETGDYTEKTKVAPGAGTVTLAAAGVLSGIAPAAGTAESGREEPALPGTSAGSSPAADAPAAGAPGKARPAAGKVPETLRDQLDRPANPRGE
ncbi:MAG: hypothetical protein VX958_06845 [Planctomycetota bacterium]|nr:hypothetical protein [Planctomycetota bacterium]